MSEGKYTRDGYVPWTPELIIEEADAEAGPGCCDESYQKLCTVMIAAPDLLEALESLLADESREIGRVLVYASDLKKIEAARAAIRKARG